MADVTIDAQLRCQLDGSNVNIDAHDGVIVISLQSISSFKTLVRLSKQYGGTRSAILGLSDVLVAKQHRLEIAIGDHTVAAMGHNAPSGLLSLLGFDQMQIRPWRILREMLRGG